MAAPLRPRGPQARECQRGTDQSAWAPTAWALLPCVVLLLGGGLSGAVGGGFPRAPHATLPADGTYHTRTATGGLLRGGRSPEERLEEPEINSGRQKPCPSGLLMTSATPRNSAHLRGKKIGGNIVRAHSVHFVH
jgi:hypothetical protein